MTKIIHGRVHGKTIELEEEIGIPDGVEVDLIVTPSKQQAAWGEGIKRSAGAAQDISEFDEAFETIERDRNAKTFRTFRD